MVRKEGRMEMKKQVIAWLVFLVLPGVSHVKADTHQSCSVIASVKNDGSGDNRIKKLGGNYAAIKMDTLTEGQIIKVKPTSGILKYVTLHERFEGGYWKTLYKGANTEFPVSRYLARSKKDPKCTHVIISVNGAHEKYEPIACTANISVCGKGSSHGADPETVPVAAKEQTVFLKTYNGHYVGAAGSGGREVVANRIQPRERETFKLIRMAGNKVAFKAYNGQYVCAEGGGGREVVANRSQVREWETFTLVTLPGNNKIALKAHNGQFVCAESGGGREVVANRSAAREWETFTLINASLPVQNVQSSEKKIALKAHNGQFVCAEGGGGRELIANRSQAREWETFTLVTLSDNNKIALKAHNGQFVCAEGGGGREVVANRSEIGQWETFTLVTLPGKNKIALKTHNGLFVCAEGGGGREIVANRQEAREWETFTMIDFN